MLETRKHRFIEFPDGFRVEHPQRETIVVRLVQTRLLVTINGQEADLIDLRVPGRQLAHAVAELLLGSLVPPRDRDPAWLIRELWALAPSIFRQRDRLLAKVEPAVLAVQVLASLRGQALVPPVHVEALYRDPYIARDVLNYHAAAIALAHLERELWEHFCRQHLKRLAEPSPDLFVEAMRDWRGLYSPTGIPYRSLNRTLMNLPNGVPAALLFNLNRIRLERPILDPLELTTLLVHAAQWRPDSNPEVVASHCRVLQHATANQILSAIGRIAIATRHRLSPRRRADIVFAISHLADYPLPHRGNLGGLVRRAIHWHQEAITRARLKKVAASLGGSDRPTARPPVALPAVPGISFLGTVSAIIEEAGRMRNCIASYARAAVSGKCFLFHIDHGGEMASVEVDPRGRIRQAAGPDNSNNHAVAWGALQLRAWAASFRPRRKRRHTVDANQLAFPFLT